MTTYSINMKKFWLLGIASLLGLFLFGQSYECAVLEETDEHLVLNYQ